MRTHENLNQWWNNVDFLTMQRITRYSLTSFDNDDDFIDACDEFWQDLSLQEKKYYYEQYKYGC